MMLTPNRKAFTLVEIMIVVAIIGVIIAIAMPAYLRAREVSRARACQENLAKIDGAIALYATDNKLSSGAPVDFTDLVKTDGTGYMLKSIPSCPSNGTYTITTIDADPKCSIDANPSAPYAPHIISTAVPAVNP